MYSTVKDAVWMIVGNKMDLESKRAVSREVRLIRPQARQGCIESGTQLASQDIYVTYS